MAHSRKPTEQETNEIIADMVRLYQKNPNLMPDMMDREDIVGHENHTDEQEAKHCLSQARVIITDMVEKFGVIFWCYGSGMWVSILVENEGKLCLIAEEHVDMMYWGTSGV